MSEQQHEALQQRDLEQHEAGAERAEVDQPSSPSRRGTRPLTSSGPTMKSTTSSAEIAISVISALSPLPNNIDRPNATSSWLRSRVVWKKNGRSSVVGEMSSGYVGDEPVAIGRQDEAAVVIGARAGALHLDRICVGRSRDPAPGT